MLTLNWNSLLWFVFIPSLNTEYNFSHVTVLWLFSCLQGKTDNNINYMLCDLTIAVLLIDFFLFYRLHSHLCTK